MDIKNIQGEVMFTYNSDTLEGVDLAKVNLEGADLAKVNLRWANLEGANLIVANLTGADLREANLTGANLTGANLTGANLKDAELRDADLRGTNLEWANLTGADLDFSMLYLSCKSLKFESDERQRIQIAYHFLSLIKFSENATEEEKEFFDMMKNYANRFHRKDVPRLE